ncbi:tripartite motif-containing protein 49D-like isoform X2 [Pteronotus mesoamericanus]|uniref:tripartite motif-containing protein 49D-like isoform X2 n=1 Tax=Pteronotus mesoamericanus TaxID=1884717 RepID=UPI0023ED117F|nr:tripartite motif-containing protein 49D-like isoform X2 [Pteronotus parnellii mesoamericanus]
MDSSIMKIFQKELTCSICMNYFIDPITIDCGHSFCRPCVYLSWQDTSVLAHCSVCKGTTQQRDFKTNICIKKLSFLVRKASLQQFLSSEHYRCGLHKETKQIFCEDDGSLLCVRCSSAQEHEAHRHRPIEEAAEEHREKLLKKMHSLWNKSCENDRNLNVETITTRSWEGFGDILDRSEAMREHMPQAVNPELSGGPISGLVEKLSCFRVNITLEYERANSHVFLNGDFRSLSVGCDSRNEPHTAPRSECFLAWGAQALTPGKYYWEIQVEDSWNWAFGVCNDYWKENMNVQLDEKGLFLLGCAKNSIHYNIFTSSPLVLQYVPKPIGSVGVFLDYEGGTVSFVDVAQSSLICSISSCSFSPGLRPVFCCSHV